LEFILIEEKIFFITFNFFVTFLSRAVKTGNPVQPGSTHHGLMI